MAKPSRHPGYQTLPNRSTFGPFQFTSDSRSILQVPFSGGELVLWDPLTLKETRRSWTTSTNGHVISVSPDASQVAHFDFHGHLRLWNARSGLETSKFIADGNCFGQAFSHDWKVFATARADGTNLVVGTWDTDAWQRKASFITPLDGAYDIDATLQPNIFLIFNQRGFQVIDLNRPKEPPKQIEGEEFDDLAVSPDGRIAAAAYRAGYIQLWNLATLQPTGRLKGFLLGTHSVAFSPDGKRLAAGSEGQEAVKLWDTESWQELLTLSGQGSIFKGLKFSPDGRYLLAINWNGLIHLWSAPTWEEIKAADEVDATARN
jgi:WD40 repeat protein